MSKRFLFTILTLVVIIVGATLAVFFAKGYRLSTENGTITGTGILSVVSEPDQASVYLDGHLTTATDDNINSLVPKKYKVRIEKEGYVTWEKEVEVKEGLVTEIEASLYRSIPTVYPITYNGVSQALLSPDGQKFVYVVPNGDDPSSTSASKKSGVWILPMTSQGINLGRGNEPRQIALSGNFDFSQAKFRWSPDSQQILVSFPSQHLLLESDRLNDSPRDVTALIEPTLKSWDQSEKESDLARLQLIKDNAIRNTASSSAILKWAPDETKVLYKKDDKSDYQLADLANQETYTLPKASYYEWLPDSEHLIMVEGESQSSPSARPSPKPSPGVEQVMNNSSVLTPTRVSIIEIDGMNKSEMFYGSLDPNFVIPWPDSSRLIVIYSLPTATASKPNVYGINLK